jgi:8-oxo-dGTP diphosphatase
MPDRGAMPARRAGYTIDVALLTPLDRHLAVLLVRTPEGALERWALPWGLPKLNDPTLEDAASRVARTALPASPTWLAQVGAFAERRHAADVELSVAFTGTVPVGTLSAPGEMAAWFPVGELPQLAPRQRAMVGSAMELVRHRMDFAPIAFRMLPPTFTLSDLQRVYEILLGHRLHKAARSRPRPSSKRPMSGGARGEAGQLSSFGWRPKKSGGGAEGSGSTDFPDPLGKEP